MFGGVDCSLTTVAIAQQPAGDAAQKTKPKRASRVITDDDLPQHLSAEPSPTSPAETQKSPGGSEKSAGSDAKADGTGAMSDKKGGDSTLEALQLRLQELEFDETNLTNGNKNWRKKSPKKKPPVAARCYKTRSRIASGALSAPSLNAPTSPVRLRH